MTFSRRSRHMAVLLGLLSASGGFMDAYSYMGRGHVFANAQTGNILLLGVHLLQGEMAFAARYLAPVAAFALGVAISDLCRFAARRRGYAWRRLVLLCETLVLGGVAFLPQEANFWANCLTSLACGAQVESFQEMRGASVATTMCIGNLRGAVHCACDFVLLRDRSALARSLMYLAVIVCFVLGALAGNWAVSALGERAMLCCCGLLAVCAAMANAWHRDPG